MPGRFVTVATTRPETMLGDTAVAINPKDERYLRPARQDRAAAADGSRDPRHPRRPGRPRVRHRRGEGDARARSQRFRSRHAPQPAEDPGDRRERRHDRRRRPLRRARPLRGAQARGGRSAKRSALLVKIEDYPLSLGKCQRCKTVVEPLVSTQWFVKTKPLAEKAIEAVEDGRIEFIPANWTKTYYEWMYNIRDWCISRQLWWGHRIPAWHCQECQRDHRGARSARRAARAAAPANSMQDPDVLDTWFSSGALAVLHARLARPDRGSEAVSTPPRC